MNVVALAKYIPDPQTTPQLGADGLLVRGVGGALDPGDEIGIELALQLAEAGGGEVTIVSMGPPEAVAAVRRALAMGAHRGVLVSDPSLRGSDALATARVLAAAIARQTYDLVIAGMESTDGYTGTVPVTVAELLGLDSVTAVRSLQMEPPGLRVERQTEAGYDEVACPLPALVTVTAGATEPRYPSLKGIMGAKQKPFEELSLADLSLDPSLIEPAQSVAGVEDAPTKAGGRTMEAARDGVGPIADLLAEAKVI